MSPIPSNTDAFTLFPTPTDVVDNSGQPPSQSQVLLGTGGLLVAVVAIMSIVAYLSRKRGMLKGVGKSHSGAFGWNGLFSTLGRRRSDAAGNGATDCAPAGIEAGVEHVNVVYATHFHPTCWNIVESHPSTPAAPAIYIEEEAQEPQVSDPKPSGVYSFLDIDDDEGSDGNGSIDRVSEEVRRAEGPGSRGPPLYDTSTPINVSFTIDAIGTTVRRGTFLSVPGEPDEQFSNEETPDSEVDFYCAPNDETLTLPPGTSCSLGEYRDALLDFELGCYCSAYTGILVTQPCCLASQSGQGAFAPDLEFNLSYGAYNVIPPETRASSSQIESLLPYDVLPGKKVNFRDGTMPIARPLPVPPVQFKDILSESSSFDSDCSPYAGIEAVTTPPRLTSRTADHALYDTFPGTGVNFRDRPLPIIPAQFERALSESSSLDSDSELPYYAGIETETTPPRSTGQFEDHPIYNTIPLTFSNQILTVTASDRARPLSIILEESEEDLSQSSWRDSRLSPSSYSWRSLKTPSWSFDARQYGEASPAYSTKRVVAIREDMTTLSSSPGSLNLLEFTETERGLPYAPVEVEPMGNTSIHDATLATVPDAPEIMQSLYKELRDFELDFHSSLLAVDTDSISDYTESDSQDEANINAPGLMDSSGPDNSRRNSLESTPSISEPDTEASTEGSIFPPTPPLESAPCLSSLLSVYETPKPSLGMLSANGDSPKSFKLNSLLSLPSKAYLRTHRDSRSLWYGPRIPLMALPRL